MRRVVSPLPDVARAAALLDREQLLTEQARHLDPGSSGRRSEIEEELAEICRLLEALGLGDKSLK